MPRAPPSAISSGRFPSGGPQLAPFPRSPSGVGSVNWGPPAGPPEEMAQKEAREQQGREEGPFPTRGSPARREEAKKPRRERWPPSPRPPDSLPGSKGTIFRCISNVQDKRGFLWAAKATNRMLRPTDWYLQGRCQSVWLCTTGICTLWALSVSLSLAQGNCLEPACKAGHPFLSWCVCFNLSAAQLQQTISKQCNVF